jgi:hypothetical protein
VNVCDVTLKTVFDLKADIWIVLQDVLTAQQAVIQNLLNYVGNFNTDLLDRVGGLEVSTTLLFNN